MLEVKKDRLTRFLDLLILKNTVQFNTTLLNIDEKGLTFRSAVHAELGRNFVYTGHLQGVWTGKEPIKAGFLKLKELRQFVSNFPDVINISVKGDKIHFTSKGLKASYKLAADINKIKTEVDLEALNKLKSKVSQYPVLTLTKEEIGKIVNYYKSIESQDVIITIKKNIFSLSFSKDENKIEAGFEAKKTFDDFETIYPIMFVDCLSCVGEEVTLSLKDKSPLAINFKEKDLEFNYYMAPIKKIEE